METIATGLQELSLNNKELPLSAHKVESSDDMLNEILLRLPVVSLVLFKSVSKRWLSLIEDATFVKRRNLIPKIDPPSGLFVHLGSYKYCSVSFDIRIPSRDEKIFQTVPSSSTTCLQSCNGLFLWSIMPGYRICIYNPTVNLFKVLPEPLYYKPELYNYTSMDFDPTKSPHYKVVHATPVGDNNRFRIQTYSSKTGIWSIVCCCTNPYLTLYYGIYWNNAIHWLDRVYDGFMHYKLDFVNKTNVLRTIQVPITAAKYCKLFKSCGCLLLLGKDKTQSNQMNVYEMRNVDSEWSLKYSVNHSRISSYGPSHCLRGVMCIAVGEREEDSFMVIKLDGEVFLYKFALKTFCKLPELESMLSKGGDYFLTSNLVFTASFASV